jgi:hypothetical protein
MFKKSLIIGTLGITFAHARNGFSSQMSHVIGGFVTVLLVAFIISRFFPKYKLKSILIGFLVSLIYVTIDQTLDYFKYGFPLNQLFDFGSHLLGSIVAVFVGKYLFTK